MTEFQNQFIIYRNVYVRNIEIDIQIMSKQNKNKILYIDVHGPTHYYSNYKYKENYFTVAKNYIMKNIINVKYITISQ